VSELAGGIHYYIKHFPVSISTIKYHLYSKQPKTFKLHKNVWYGGSVEPVKRLRYIYPENSSEVNSVDFG